jgi:EAL and modified HD-GYP domain-containing signal transduction protein
MSPSVLGHLTLGYQPVWNRLRHAVAMMLFIDQPDNVAVDAAHLLAMLDQAWSEQSPILILCVQARELLLDLLEHTTPDGPWIAVQEALLADPLVVAQVHAAHRRGLRLLWRGEPGHRASADTAACFALSVISLNAGEALLGLRASLKKAGEYAGPPADLVRSPVLADQIFEAVPSKILVEHCLDQQGAWGVAGWPVDDVLFSYPQPIQPDRQTITRLIGLTDADAPLDLIEHALAEEPVLAYRFLLYSNSAALGLRSDVESLRHGLMLLGLSNFRNWLLAQQSHAANDINLHPVRAAMVLRARLTEQLLDAGEEQKLRSEVYLCGLLSQIDLVLGEPLSAALQRLPVSDRITAAIQGKTGPYAPYLEVATALEFPRMDTVPVLCEEHGIDLGEVNRVLLRVLAAAQPHAQSSPSRMRE